MSPEKGIITAIVAGLFISLFGGSKVQIGGPTGAFIVIVAGIINQYGMQGLTIATLMAGVFLIGFGLLRLGTIIKYIPYPIIVGFTSGIAVTIFTTQVKDLLGMQMERAERLHREMDCLFPESEQYRPLEHHHRRDKCHHHFGNTQTEPTRSRVAGSHHRDDCRCLAVKAICRCNEY